MIWSGLKQVFTEPGYVLLAAITAVVVFAFATWLPNIALIWQIATAGAAVPVVDKIRILVAFAGSIYTNFTLSSALAVITVALLFGANLALITYFYRRRRQLKQAGEAAATVGGLASGLFGVGCAACGAVVLSPALSIIGASALIAWLPFGGEEFSLLGIVMLGCSLVWMARKIAKPFACPLIIIQNNVTGTR